MEKIGGRQRSLCGVSLMKKRTLLSWSSGKDSAWALHLLRQHKELEVVGLLTTVNKAFQRVSMHGVREGLLRMQANAIDLPLEILRIPHPCSNREYEVIMQGFFERVRHTGVDHMAFGDIFLQDVRDYRERSLRNTGVSPLFPLWGASSEKLAREMIANGLRTVITCVDPRSMPAYLVGREFDESVLDSLPEHVDPCGENGEFHTFAIDGPEFHQPLLVDIGEIVKRDRFLFADILPQNHNERR
jgi:uncharacterized protein (TIGR00290 family)